jgi:hypothetical protein
MNASARMEPASPSKLIVEPTREALACCIGWLEGHARLMLSDAGNKRAIFTLCFDFVCADGAANTLDLKKVLYVEAFLKEAFAREGLRAPTVVDFFNSASPGPRPPSPGASGRSVPG